MSTSRLFWKILGAHLVVVLALWTLAWFVIVQRQESLAREQRDRRLLDACRAMRMVVSGKLVMKDFDGLREHVDNLARETGMRLTVIGADGKVLADSSRSPDSMDNHLERPEVRVSSGTHRYGIAQRTSTSTGKAMYYCALPIVEGEWPDGYVRVSVEAQLLDEPLLAARRWLMFGGVLALAATVVSTWWVEQRLFRTVHELNRRVSDLTSSSIDAGPAARQVDDEETAAAATLSTELDKLNTGVGQLKDRFAWQMDRLRDNADRLSNVLANMAEGVLALDAQQRIVLANEASRRLLELTVEEVEGRPLWEVTRNRAIEETVAEALHSGRPCQKEIESLGPGARRILSLRASRLPGDPSPGVMIVLHDVTDLRRLENLRREFVANVSHELKTPLASIKAYAETLRMGAIDDPENNVEFVRQIEEQSDRLHELILDLLQLARVESGQEVFEITSVHVESVVKGCLKSYAAPAAAKQITLVADAASPTVWVRADEEGFRTMISNLIDNAVKYTPNGGRVVVRWGADQREGWCEVQDTGIGIAKVHQARIFERFYRVDKARSRELGGTGLGLSIVKHLAQAFGGVVRVDSQPRVGSAFRVVLPLADEADDMADPAFTESSRGLHNGPLQNIRLPRGS